MLYAVGHSAVWTGMPSYVELVNAQRIKSGHFYFYTVLGAVYEVSQLQLKPDDKIIFNFGINDCIYRKTKDVQLPFFQGLIDAIQYEDPEASQYFQGKLNTLICKQPAELLQLFNFKEFRELTRKLFKPFRNRGLVIGIAWFPKTHPIIHYATVEAEHTNQILKESAAECGLQFLDMWHPPEYTKDGSHYTLDGHILIANYVKENLK